MIDAVLFGSIKPPDFYLGLVGFNMMFFAMAHK
jgi:hypothetical protein